MEVMRQLCDPQSLPRLNCWNRRGSLSPGKPFALVTKQLTRNPLVMAQHRNSVRIELKISQTPDLSRCTFDKSLRVMLLCAGDDHGIQDISFPHQAEVKVNGGDIKANMRGLKGKPGSTRPVDITDALRLDKHAYVNNIEFTYALTNKVKSRDQLSESRVSHDSFPLSKWYSCSLDFPLFFRIVPSRTHILTTFPEILPWSISLQVNCSRRPRGKDQRKEDTQSLCHPGAYQGCP
jgi:hypothetical protein